MSNKHKHYDKIVSKAANVGLVQFIKINGKWEDAGLSDKFISFSEGYDYFLCLPQHKEACLHWLNGGESQLEYTHQSYPAWNGIDNDAKDWSMGHVFMDGSLKIRIKPKKTKRWIGVFKEGELLKNTELSYKTKEQLKGSAHAPNGFDGWQFIEIEVEV